MPLNLISKNKVNDFISFAKTGKIDKLQKAISSGIDILSEDSKAFILSSRYGQLESLKILLENLESIEKRNIIRHCFLEGCNHNRKEIIDYLLDNYYEELNAEGMEEIALKSCMIGENSNLLLYLCAKYNFNINLNKDILNWALKNDYMEAYSKLEIVLLNKTFKDKNSSISIKKDTVKI